MTSYIERKIQRNIQNMSEEEQKTYFLDKKFSTLAYTSLQKIIPPAYLDDKDFRDAFGQKVYRHLTGKLPSLKPIRTSYSTVLEGGEIPRVLSVWEDFLTDKHKADLSGHFAKKLKSFYTYSRRKLLRHMFGWGKIDKDVAKDLLQNHYRMLNKEQAATLQRIIVESGAELGDKERESLSRIPSYFISQYTQDDLDSNPESRASLIKAMAQKQNTRNAFRSSNLRLEITREDLEKLPSNMRFEFLQSVLGPLTRHDYSFDNTFVKKLNLKTKELSYDDIEELVFSLAINKNRQVSSFIESVKTVFENKSKITEALKIYNDWLS